jgi:hypothetical protein
MKTMLVLAALAISSGALPRLCHALEEIEVVTAERAKELGLEIRTTAAGPDTVRIELEFETKGELANYSRVALEMHDGQRLLLTSTLREEPAKPGRIVVGFAADRARLNTMTAKVVVQDSPRSRVGHVIRIHQFVDLKMAR